MARGVKKAPVHNGKPITAFFTRSSAGPSSSQDASRPAGKRSSNKTPTTIEQSPIHMTKQETLDANLNSDSPEQIAVVTDPPLTESPVKTPQRSAGNAAASSASTLKPPANMSSLKRTRSPSLLEAPAAMTTVVLSNSLVASHRPKVLSEVVQSESKYNTIYVCTPNVKGNKRARLSPSDDSTLSELTELIPSSQSEEEERPIIPDTPTVKGTATVTTYSVLHTPRSLTPEEDTDTAQIHEDLQPSTIPSSPTVEAMPSQPRNQPFDHMMTPPPSDLPSLPPTPVALDTATKTAQLIADIKARAYAQANSSPEPVKLQLVDDFDISSDEDDFLPILCPPLKKITPPTPEAESSKKDAPDHLRTNRYSLRKRSSSPSITRGPAKPVQTQRTSGRKFTSKAADPISALLKEKSLAEKRGKGNDAFARAELRTHGMSGGSLFDEMEEDEEDSFSDQDDEKIATLMANPDLFAKDIASLDLVYKQKPKGHAVPDGFENEKETTLFGRKGGQAIVDIFKEDQALKTHDEILQKTSGIRFWSALPGDNTVASSMNHNLPIPLPGSSAQVQIFNACLRRNDILRASLLINKNFLDSLDVCDQEAVFSRFCDMIISYPPAPDVLCEAVMNTLGHFWLTCDATTGITFPRILATVQALGADASIISVQQWAGLDVNMFKGTTHNSRQAILTRLMTLITACANSKKLLQHEVPDIAVILLLMAMDENVSSQLLQDIILTVDLVCNCIVENEMEVQLSRKVLQTVQTYNPINQCRLVSILSNGSLTTRRIANFVAYCIITENTSPNKVVYSDTPPLSDVINQLAPYSKLSALPPGKFALHPGTDYVDLGFYITILGVAVSNLRDYTIQEALSAGNSNSHAVARFGEKIKTDLQMLHSALETLHSNITDTRATHLERSRTKACIKGLAMNIYYQREHWLKNELAAKPRTLAAYFQKKTKP